MARFNIESNIEEQTGLFALFGGTIGRLPAIFATATGAVRTFTAALLANPITAILVGVTAAITGLIGILSRFQPVIDLFSQGMAGASAIVDVLADRLGFLFGVTERNTLSFREAATAAIELERASQRLADREIEQITISATRRAEFARFRLIAADATRTDQERIEALTEAQRIQNEGIDDEIEIRTERLRILREQQALGANDRDDNREAAQLEAELIDLDAQRLAQLRQTETQRSALILRTQRQAEADRNAAAATRERNRAEAERIRLATEQLELTEARSQESQAIQLLRAQGVEEEALLEIQLMAANARGDFETADELNFQLEIARYRRLRQETMAQADAEKQAEAVKQQAVEDAENAKTNARRASIAAAIGFVTGLLGDSKGAMIAGLLATSAFEASNILAQGATAATTAQTYAASVAAVPFLGAATAAALPAQLAAISAGTGAGLSTVAVQTGLGIGKILATPGEPPTISGSTSAPAGPTVSTPTIAAELSPMQQISEMVTAMNNASPEVLLTPRDGEGSFSDTARRDNRRRNRQTLGRNGR